MKHFSNQNSLAQFHVSSVRHNIIYQNLNIFLNTHFALLINYSFSVESTELCQFWHNQFALLYRSVVDIYNLKKERKTLFSYYKRAFDSSNVFAVFCNTLCREHLETFKRPSFLFAICGYVLVLAALDVLRVKSYQFLMVVYFAAAMPLFYVFVLHLYRRNIGELFCNRILFFFD